MGINTACWPLPSPHPWCREDNIESQCGLGSEGAGFKSLQYSRFPGRPWASYSLSLLPQKIVAKIKWRTTPYTALISLEEKQDKNVAGRQTALLLLEAMNQDAIYCDI